MVADRPAVDALKMNARSARSQGGAATAQRERFVERADRSSRHRRRCSHRFEAPLGPLPRQTQGHCAQRQSPTGIRQSPQQPHAGFRRRLANESRTAEQSEICADSTPLALTGAVSARRPLDPRCGRRHPASLQRRQAGKDDIRPVALGRPSFRHHFAADRARDHVPMIGRIPLPFVVGAIKRRRSSSAIARRVRERDIEDHALELPYTAGLQAFALSGVRCVEMRTLRVEAGAEEAADGKPSRTRLIPDPPVLVGPIPVVAEQAGVYLANFKRVGRMEIVIETGMVVLDRDAGLGPRVLQIRNRQRVRRIRVVAIGVQRQQVIVEAGE